MREITIEATIENIEKVTGFIDSALEEVFCPPKAQMQIDVAVDEIFGNIAHYAYAPNVGMATVCVDTNGESVTLIFKDNGVPYDPLEKSDPDITLSAEERPIGGLGIFIVKKLMDEVSYDRVGDSNILTLKKTLLPVGRKGIQ